MTARYIEGDRDAQRKVVAVSDLGRFRSTSPPIGAFPAAEIAVVVLPGFRVRPALALGSTVYALA
jgi:hypothetical protein